MEQTRENKMGIMPVNKRIISMSLPMVVSMLVQALYNIVDSIFVSRLSEDALTAVSMAFPMQNLMISVAVGIGVGIQCCREVLVKKDLKLQTKRLKTVFFLKCWDIYCSLL